MARNITILAVLMTLICSCTKTQLPLTGFVGFPLGDRFEIVKQYSDSLQKSGEFKFNKNGNWYSTVIEKGLNNGFNYYFFPTFEGENNYVHSMTVYVALDPDQPAFTNINSPNNPEWNNLFSDRFETRKAKLFVVSSLISDYGDPVKIDTVETSDVLRINTSWKLDNGLEIYLVDNTDKVAQSYNQRIGESTFGDTRLYIKYTLSDKLIKELPRKKTF